MGRDLTAEFLRREDAAVVTSSIPLPVRTRQDIACQRLATDVGIQVDTAAKTAPG
jgi:hypothetical protein